MPGPARAALRRLAAVERLALIGGTLAVFAVPLAGIPVYRLAFKK